MSTSPPTLADAPERRLRQLDGLRAFAVGGVLLEHGIGMVGSSQGGFALGSAGVRLFFVLSGFLITGILLRAKRTATARGVSMWTVSRAFYCRRAVRILPLGYLAILAAWVVGAPSVREHPWFYATYTSNFLTAAHGFSDPSLNHFWSLAVEEQFYLVWPIILLTVPDRFLSAAMAAAALAAMVARGFFLAHGLDVASYVMTPTRLDALAVGGIVAWLQMSYPTRGRRLVAILIAGGLGSRLVAHYAAGSAVVLPLPETGYVLLSAAIVLAVSRGFDGMVGAILSSRLMVGVGTISYGVYVYHMLIAGLVPIVSSRLGFDIPYPQQDGWLRLGWMVGTTVPVAAASWFWFERPLNDLKSRFPYVPLASRERRDQTADSSFARSSASL